MGVKGLQSFLKNNRENLATPCYLNNIHLVIDGMNLAWYLHAELCLRPGSAYFNSFKYGLDYVGYSCIVKQFFAALNSCSITPIILYDGSTVGDESDKASKEETIYRRALEKFNVASSLDESVETQSMVMSTNVMNTLVAICAELNLTSVATPFEADSHIARIANENKCPVLTNDSDFMIYELDKGFILLDDLDFRRIAKDKNGRDALVCNAFSQKNICRFLRGLKPENLALMSILLGNDYVDSSEFSRVIYDICDRPYYGDLVAHSKKHKSIANMLQWLGGRTLDQALTEITSRVPETSQLRLRRRLTKLLRSYSTTDEDDFLQKVNNIYPEEMAVDRNPDHLPSKYILNALKKNKLSGISIDIIFHNTHYIYLEVEDLRLASTNSVIYRTLALQVTILRPRSYTNLTTYQRRLAREEDALIIYDRVDSDYKRVVLYPLEKLARFGSLEHMNLYTFITLEPEMKKNLLMCAFRFNNEEFNLMKDTLSNVFVSEYLDQATLCLILVKFIGQETNQPPKPQFVDSLLLTLFYYAHLNQKVVSSILKNQHYNKILLELKRHELLVNNIDYTYISSIFRRVVHFINQLQVTIRSFKRLNDLTGEHFVTPRLDRYFNSTLIFRITKLMRMKELDLSQLCENCDCLLDICASVKVQVHADE